MNILNKKMINELNERFGGISNDSGIKFSYFKNDLIIKIKGCNKIATVSKIRFSLDRVDGLLSLVADYSHVNKNEIKPGVIMDILETVATSSSLSVVVYKGKRISEIYNPSCFVSKQSIYSCII